MSTLFSAEKAERLSKIRINYKRAKTCGGVSQQTDDVGFLLDCLNEAERACADLRLLTTKIRDSRDVLIAGLESRLAEALDAADAAQELLGMEAERGRPS